MKTATAVTIHCCWYLECIERSGRGHCWCEDKCEVTGKGVGDGQ